MINKINRGDIFVYDFGLDYSTNIECKKRPALIVSNNKGNAYGPTCLVAPITTRPYEKQKNNAWQVYFQNDNREQVILLEQIKCVPTKNLEKYVGKLDDFTMKKVDLALCVELGLPVTQETLNQSMLISNMYNSIDSNIKELLNNNLQEAINSPHNSNDVINALNNLECNIINEISNVTFESKVNDTLNNLSNIFNVYNQNLSKMLNVLINLYDKSDCNKLDDFKNKSLKTKSVNKIERDVKVNDELNSNIIKGIKIKSINDMIEFMDYYMEHSFEEIENKYHFDKKSAMNRKTNYIKRLKNANIDVSKYLIRKNKSRKGE